MRHPQGANHVPPPSASEPAASSQGPLEGLAEEGLLQ